MCIFNIHCNAKHCSCGSTSSSDEQSDGSSTQLAEQEQEICYLMRGNANLLAYIYSAMQTVAVNFQTLREVVGQTAANGVDTVTTDQSAGIKQALRELLFGSAVPPQFCLRLKINEPLPRPIYKERAFAIDAILVDTNGTPAALPDSTRFKVLLFTSDDPPKHLKLDTAGQNIMRGTIDIRFDAGTTNVVMSKVVIKEVTSHFSNGCFFLVLMPTTPYIEPLIIENVQVKARKVMSTTGRGQATKEPRLVKKGRVEKK